MNTSGFWSDLIDLNKHVDSLLDKVFKDVEPYQPIGRETPVTVSIEALFEHLPATYATAVSPLSDAVSGNSIKRPSWENTSSRIYIRELSFLSYLVIPATSDVRYSARTPNQITPFPFNWRWNFRTSITDRFYAPNRMLSSSGGRSVAGNHLAFREPLVVEPREGITFECELLGGFGMNVEAIPREGTSAIVAMIMSGYREGV